MIFVFLSATGMLLVALSPPYTDGGTIATKLAGIVLASLSSGGGELSFVGLTHFYGPFSLAAWGSGTGAAGLVGAGAYAVATTSLGLSVKATLLASSCLPAVMVVSFFMVLPRSPLKYTGYRAIEEREELAEERAFMEREGERDGFLDEGEHLLAASDHPNQSEKGGWQRFKADLKRVRGLFFPL